jgi:3D (Asp-Asp-Asp) domain-containing protein
MKSKKIDLWVLFFTLAVFVLMGWLYSTARQADIQKQEIAELREVNEALRTDLEELRQMQQKDREELGRLSDSVADLEVLGDQTDGNVGRIFYILRKWQREKTQEEQERKEAEELATKQKKSAQQAPQKATAPSQSVASAENTPEGMTYLGDYQLTAYEWTGNPCANGNYPTEGLTIASNTLPIGTRVYIEGIGERTVEDTGGMPGNVIDIYMGDPGTCVQFGRQSGAVYIIPEE